MPSVCRWMPYPCDTCRNKKQYQGNINPQKGNCNMLKTFRIGGIHPKENKLTSQCPVTAIPVPRQVSLMLNQHIGAPANCIVKKGDTVKVGTLIAEANGFVSSNIHSPVSGTVSKIDKIANAFGIYSQAIIIDTEGDDWEEYIDRTPSLEKEIALSSNEIIQKIAQNGIVGLGGATFPTHVKLTPPKEFKPTVTHRQCDGMRTLPDGRPCSHARIARTNYNRLSHSNESYPCKTGLYRSRK